MFFVYKNRLNLAKNENKIKCLVKRIKLNLVFKIVQNRFLNIKMTSKSCTNALKFQFFQVLQHELRSMREACMMLERGYQPGITFIAVQKRHHTRLFAVDKKDQVGK